VRPHRQGVRDPLFLVVLPDPAVSAAGAHDSGRPEFFIRTHIDGQNKVPGATEPAAFAEYLRCYLDPRTRHAMCEDYRAAAGIDLDHDAADQDTQLAMPVLALWGGLGTVGALYDVLETWREKAVDVRGRALACGHAPQEECPEEVLAELRQFLLT
jgi:haloacetate dehalogenase